MTFHHGHLQAADTPAAKVKLEKLFTGEQRYHGFKHDAHLLVRHMFTLSPNEVAGEDGLAELQKLAKGTPGKTDPLRIESLRITSKVNPGNLTHIFVALGTHESMAFNAFFSTGASPEHHHTHIKNSVRIQRLIKEEATTKPAKPHPFD